MNQFVPQLMLGNALANSTNAPDYNPIWIEMDSWHVGSQYFMALCNGTSGTFDCKNWIPKAATGKLVAVQPGEMVETSFVLKEEKGCCKEVASCLDASNRGGRRRSGTTVGCCCQSTIYGTREFYD